MPNMNRLYVDLIYKRSDKYANYDPASGPLSVGTYGTVTRDGGFLVYGDIYSDGFMRSFNLDVTILPAVTRANEECIKFHSAHVRSLQVTVKTYVIILILHVDLSADSLFLHTFSGPPLRRVVLEGSYELSKRAAAALIVHNAVVTEIPPESLKDLASIMEQHEDLQDKVVVEKAYACDAYYLVLRKTAAVDMKVNFCLKTDTFIDGVEVQPAGWASEGDGGVARWAGRAGGPRVYYPIYSLKCLNNKKFLSKDVPANRFRASGSVEPPEDWVDFTLPWADLDDDGDEISSVSSPHLPYL